MRIRWSALLLAGLTGCHSAYVDAVVANRTGEPVTVLEVDYPSASFGTETLASGADYHYRFKVQGEGPLKLLWTDAKRHDHTANGPELHEGADGSLQIVLQHTGRVDWNMGLKK
jgi:hypothetical protein